MLPTKDMSALQSRQFIKSPSKLCLGVSQVVASRPGRLFERQRDHLHSKPLPILAATAAAATSLASASDVDRKWTVGLTKDMCSPAPLTNDWLEQAIPDLVKTLCPPHASMQPQQQKACVQRVSCGAFGQVMLDYQHFQPEDLSSPQVWRDLASAALQSVRGQQASSIPIALVLARPIPDPSHYCPFSNPSSPPGSPTSTCQPPNCTPTSTANSLSSASIPAVSVLTKSKMEPELEGAIDTDNCCSGLAPTKPGQRQPTDHHTHNSQYTCNTVGSTAQAQQASSVMVPAQPYRSRRRFLRRQQAAAHQHSQSTWPSASKPVTRIQEQYYGVAIQQVGPFATSNQSPNPLGKRPLDGCYVLKLSRNRDVTGCTCTHYTLQHVCQGLPLYQQLQDSWLAHA